MAHFDAAADGGLRKKAQIIWLLLLGTDNRKNKQVFGSVCLSNSKKDETGLSVVLNKSANSQENINIKRSFGKSHVPSFEAEHIILTFRKAKTRDLPLGECLSLGLSATETMNAQLLV